MKKRGVLIAVALSLFVAAGVVTYTNWPTPPAQFPRTTPTSAPVLDLNSPAEFVHNPTLMRELMRQALLIAQRDEYGFPTRDATLREPTDNPPSTAAHGLAAHAFIRGYQGVQIQFFKDTNGVVPPVSLSPVTPTETRKILFQTLVPNVDIDLFDYPALVARAEAYARNEFKAAIAAPTTRPATKPTPLPANVDRLLAEMNFISQYAAVRAAHRAGQFPDALAALARGYANLGQLTAFQWSAACKAFTARSLLYAQRMVVAAAPADLPRALRHRAYAFALAGLQAPAISDLDRADQLDPKPAEVPAWLASLRPFCRYQPGELANIAGAAREPADAALPLFLCFLTVERCNSPSVIMGYGQVALSASPDCFRVVDTMMASSGVSANHVLTEAAPSVFAQSLRDHLPKIADLPAPARDALRNATAADFDPAASAAVAPALIAAGRDDTAEPSWTVLGHLIEETHFAHVQRRAAFMRDMWGVETDDFTRETRPLYQRHPYRGLIDAYGRGRGVTGLAPLLQPAAQHLAGEQPTFAHEPLLIELTRYSFPVPGAEINDSFWTWHGAFIDLNAVDMERYLSTRLPRASIDSYYIRALHKVSPFSPTYMARKIARDWDAIAPALEAWKKDWGDHPAFSGALGRKYSELRQWPEAEKFLRAYIAKAPDQWAFEMLAANFIAQGDEAGWLATLKQRLDAPDFGLDHAQTNMLIARHYMRLRKWETARPYADAAAQSYAQWALETAAECYDGLGDTNRAAAIRAAIADRYGPPPAQ